MSYDGPERRNGGHCDDFCAEHSGLKVLIWVILVGVVGNLALLGYNTFGATAAFRTEMATAITEIKGKISALETSDNMLSNRVSRLEKTRDGQ